MNCLVDDSQWLDAFQSRVLFNAAESSTRAENLSNKDKSDTHGGGSADKTSCVSACVESESPWDFCANTPSQISFSEKNSVAEGLSAGLKRKWGVDSDGQSQRPPQHPNGQERMYLPKVHGHNMMVLVGRKSPGLSLENPPYFPAHINTHGPLDAAMADGLPAPEFVKLGRSSVAAETHRMVRTAMAAFAAPPGAASPPG